MVCRGVPVGHEHAHVSTPLQAHARSQKYAWRVREALRVLTFSSFFISLVLSFVNVCMMLRSLYTKADKKSAVRSRLSPPPNRCGTVLTAVFCM